MGWLDVPKGLKIAAAHALANEFLNIFADLQSQPSTTAVNPR